MVVVVVDVDVDGLDVIVDDVQPGVMQVVVIEAVETVVSISIVVELAQFYALL